MRPRGSPNHPSRPFGRPRVSSVLSEGGFWRLLGLSRDALERSWAPLGYPLGAWGEHLGRFGLMLVSQSGVRRENSEKLEFDDRLNENAMFLRPQGFQNKTKMVPKLANRRKKSREEAKREQRVPWEPSRPAWGRFPSISSSSGGGSGGREGGDSFDDKPG